MINSILVVCIGNICRSPTGERLLKTMLPEINIASAGLGAMVGQAADDCACRVAATYGLSLEGHVARQLTPAMCRDYDLILVMERKYIDVISHIDPVVRGKTMLYGHWLNQQEISDPYKKSHDAFEAVYSILENAAQKWADILSI